MKETYYINNQQKETESWSENTFDLNAAKINLKVIGVGGAGNNAIQLMQSDQYKNVDFLVANTDAQALALNSCKKQIPLGKNSRGLGAGSDPEVGKKSAAESIRDIEECIKGADVIIIAAGFGGGTGTGATPIIAEAARNAGALTIAIITTPFSYEGKKRNRIAQEGIEALKSKVDSYIVISNDKLADKFSEVPVDDAFVYSNKYLKNIILTIHDILYRIGKINIDYADVRKILNDAGLTVVGLGKASGKERAIKAVDKAFQNNLYKYDINGAQRFLINIQYDKNATINEIRTAISRVNEILAKNTDVEDDIIIGQERIDSEEDIFKVSIIAGKVNENQIPNDLDLVQNLINENNIEKTVSSQIIETITNKIEVDTINSTIEKNNEENIKNTFDFEFEKSENYYPKKETNISSNNENPSNYNTQEINDMILINNDENEDDVNEKKSKSELDIDSWFRI